MQKRQWRKKGKHLRKYWNGSWRKSETIMKWLPKQGIRAEKFILRHWWIFVISRIRSWSLIRVVLRGDMWKMIPDHAQYLLNNDHHHHNWQPQKSWTLFQDYRDAQDKQQMQYQLTPRSEWKMHQRYWKFQSQNARTLGYVYQSTNGPNHGPVWKIQSLLLNEICTVTFWQDCHEKGNTSNLYQNSVGEKFQIGNVCSLTGKLDNNCLCTWMTLNWLERNKISIRRRKYSWKTLIWENQHHSLTMFIWVALKEKVN